MVETVSQVEQIEDLVAFHLETFQVEIVQMMVAGQSVNYLLKDLEKVHFHYQCWEFELGTPRGYQEKIQEVVILPVPPQTVGEMVYFPSEESALEISLDKFLEGWVEEG